MVVSYQLTAAGRGATQVLIVVTVHAEALAPVARVERMGGSLSHLQYHVLVHQTIR